MAKPDYSNVHVQEPGGELRPLTMVSEIWPGLYQGVRPTTYVGYDFVINCERYFAKGPAAEYNRLFVHLPMQDDDEFPIPEAEIKAFARDAKVFIEAGMKVLVHCSGGLNRSSLVTCEILKQLGLTPKEAVTLLRAKRDNWCLCNKTFERWVLGRRCCQPLKQACSGRRKMLEETCDLWSHVSDYNVAIVVTTNGTLKGNGKAVMGAGCAKEAKGLDDGDKLVYPHLATLLGERIKEEGNKPFSFDPRHGLKHMYARLITFPTKHNWWERSDLELIKKSASRVAALTDRYSKVYIPRPGCGLGELSWEEVKPVIAPYFTEDKFVIVSRPGE